LASVVDECELSGALGQGPEASDELFDEHCELGDVGAVAAIGVADERDAADCRDDKAEADGARVGSLLLGVVALGDRGGVVRGVDMGGGVRHVEHEPREVDGEHFDQVSDDATLDLLLLVFADRVHRVPRAPVAEDRGRQAHEPVAARVLPPVRELALGAGVDDPVRRSDGDPGPDRGCPVGTPRADDLVDDLGDPEQLEHRPHRSEVTEGEVSGAVRHHRRAGHRRLDADHLTQVALGDHLRLAAHSANLSHVAARVTLDRLADDGGEVISG
jgi:hypothetical protein